jgi:ribonuclease VapC
VIVDSSAVIAILRNEPEAAAMSEAIDRVGSCSTSAVNYVEAAIVTDSGRSLISSRRFDDFFPRGGHCGRVSHSGASKNCSRSLSRFWQGTASSWANLGDCFAYALAKEKGETLLFKGNDFCHTDIEPAID